MSSMRSPHIVYFYGMIHKPQVCLVMMCCEHGSLSDLLKSEFCFSWEHVFKWSIQMVKGVSHLHNWKPPILHRDLKTLNLLVDEFLNIYVSDFGISRFVVDDNLSTLMKLRGTYAYCAPEIYLGGQASTRSDVFSIGIILWEIVTRCASGDYIRPYSEYKNFVLDFQIIIQVAKNNVRPTIHPSTPKVFSSLIQQCWDTDPEKRIGCVEILDRLSALHESYKTKPQEWVILPRNPSLRLENESIELDNYKSDTE